MIYLLQTMVFHSKLPVNQITPGHLFARLIRHRGSSLEIGWGSPCFSSKYWWKFTANNGPASNYIDSNFDFARHVHFTSENRKYQQHPRIGNFHHQNIPKWWFQDLPGSPTCVVLGDMSFRAPSSAKAYCAIEIEFARWISHLNQLRSWFSFWYQLRKMNLLN